VSATRVTTVTLREMKDRGEKISMLTAYDYPIALLLEEAGIFSLVLEGIPWQVAEVITEELRIPTIGIGAGSSCDGQVWIERWDSAMTTTPLTPKGLNSWKATSTTVALHALAAETMISRTASTFLSNSGSHPYSSTKRCLPSALN